MAKSSTMGGHTVLRKNTNISRDLKRSVLGKTRRKVGGGRKIKSDDHYKEKSLKTSGCGQLDT